MKLLEVYRKGKTSLLTAEQKEEIFKRFVLYKEGKMKGVSLPEVRKRVKQKLSEKYAGKLPDNIAEEFQNFVSQTRSSKSPDFDVQSLIQTKMYQQPLFEVS